MSGMNLLFWYHEPAQFRWAFRDESGARRVCALSEEVVWEARDEPGRSGLQSFLAHHGLDPLPDRAFDEQRPDAE